MLTKQDLNEFSKIIRPLHKDIKATKKDIKAIKKEVKITQEDVRDIREKQNSIVSFFEKEYLNLRTRIERIEEHLGL